MSHPSVCQFTNINALPTRIFMRHLYGRLGYWRCLRPDHRLSLRHGSRDADLSRRMSARNSMRFFGETPGRMAHSNTWTLGETDPAVIHEAIKTAFGGRRDWVR